MASRKKGIEPERLAEAAAQLLKAFPKGQQRWTTLPTGGLSKELYSAARRELVKQQRIVEVGRVSNASLFSLVGQSTPKERLLALAESVIVERGVGSGLVLVPLSKDHETYKGVPGKVKDHVVPAARRLVEARKAFRVRVGQTNLIALAANLSGLLHPEAAAPSGSVAPAVSDTSPLDPQRVVEAYTRLTRESRSPHVIVSDLQRESGVPLEPLKAWLLSECRAHRAIPLLGEPARATEEQLSAALVVEGQHHLYVRLVEEGLS